METNISSIALESVVNHVAHEVNRSALWDALFATRLVEKDVTRADLKRRYPDPQAWARYILKCLDEPSTREEAFRVLSRLVESFIQLPTVDTRIKTAVHKARVAAERQDVERLRKALNKLSQDAWGEAEPALQRPELVVYLAATTSRARETVASVLGSDAPSNISSVADTPVPVASEPAHDGPKLGSEPRVAIDLVAAVTEAHVERPTSLDGLRSALRQLAATRASSEPAWDAQTLRFDIEAQLPEVEWPSSAGLGLEIKGQLRLLRGLVEDLERVSSDVETLVEARDRLQSLHGGLERVGAMAKSAESLLGAVRLRAEAICIELDAEDQTEARRLLANIGSSENHANALRQLAELVQRTRARRVERLGPLMERVSQIALSSSALPSVEVPDVRAQATKLLLTGDVAGLERLKIEVERRIASAAALRHKIASAAERAIDIVEHLHSLSEESAARCLEAVKSGDTKQAIASLLVTSSSSSGPSGPEHGAPPPPAIAPQEAPPKPTPDPIPVAALDRFEPRNAITAEYVRRRQGGGRKADVVIRLLEDETEAARAVQLASELVNAYAGTPLAAEAVFRLLEWRAIEELARGSVLGAIEHGLDIAELASRAKTGGERWLQRGAALLALVPPLPSTTGTWGRQAANAAREILANENPLPLALERLFGGVAFAQAIAERFSHAVFRSFVPSLAATLFTVAVQDEERAHLRDELALGIANGTRYGSDEVVRHLLLELATAGGVEDQDRVRLRALLGQASGADKRGLKQLDRRILSRLPDWLQTAADSYLATRAMLNEDAPRGTDRDKTFTVKVPKSVNEAGGFVFREGDRVLHLALLVSSALPSIFNAELILRASDNRDWLERDLVAHISSLVSDPSAEQQRQLLQLQLPLARELRTDDASLTMVFSFRWMESETAKSPPPQSRSVTIPLTQSRQLTLDDYPGASGTPILLVEQNLELSSSSVRSALTEILEQFRAGKPAAFLITGRRRRGKTSILGTVMSDRTVQKHFVVVSDSLEDVPFRNLQQAFAHLGKILDASAARVGVEMPSLADRLRYSGGWQDMQGWLLELGSKLTKPTRLLLLVDEFQKWISALDAESRTRVLAALRGLMNRPESSQLSFSMVLSGLSNIKRYIASSADFRNAVKWKVIGPFTNLEAERLIRSNKSIEFDVRAITALRDFSGGNPFLINLLGNKVVEWLRQQRCSYCFREDVDHAVRDELGTEESRGWSFVQYLLKEGEEDHAPELEELPTLVAVAWSLQQRGQVRSFVRLREILADLDAASVDHDQETIKADLEACIEDELLLQEDDRFSFASQCLREWLAARHDNGPLPIRRELREGLVLNRYRVVKNLPRGGQASSVFTAVDTHLHNQSVVLKIYARDQEGGASSLVEREARALTKVEHSGVIRVQDYGEDPVYGHVLVLEHALGDDLRRLLHNPPPAAAKLAGAEGDLAAQVNLLSAVTHALSECHRAGVVHKDIKPEHILVRQESGVLAPKIIDFGLAVEVPTIPGGRVPTTPAFSAPYVAPEKLRGEPREAPADIYSLGVVAFELLTGKLPFEPTVSPVGRGRPLELKAVRPGVTQRLSGLVERMLSDNPKERPTAVSVASELEVVLEPQEWTDFWEAAKTAFNLGNRDAALRGFQQAAFAAPLRSRRSAEYLELLEHLVMILDEEHAILRVCEQLMQPLLSCCLSASDVDHGRRQALLRDFCKLILQAPRLVGDGTTAAALIHALCSHLLGTEPHGVAVGVVEALLGASENPVAWEQRETIHELCLHYRASLMKPGSLEAWCIAACRRLREHNSSLLDCQRWLRRAERLGVSGNREYREEREKLEREISNTAHAVRLPRTAHAQEDAAKIVGDDERGHLQVDRIVAWARRLYRRHPYVHAVRRVQKDGAIAPRPSRVLDLSNIARHAKVAIGISQDRIIPAVLDQSFCAESCALRINILLDEDCTVQEREAAMAELKSDTELFPSET
jgi:hypothetical protein